uniref:Ig-like domain-containing protein n=1 Tax=Pundamilia nyererei TaxID=303518 RepID=A0A3B4GR57_9CICH
FISVHFISPCIKLKLITSIKHHEVGCGSLFFFCWEFATLLVRLLNISAKYSLKYQNREDGVGLRSPFKDRSQLNPEDFTLTVRRLTLQDSGDFIFVSAVFFKQRPSVSITLQVHEPITKQPVIKISSTWIPSNESCKVLLECSTTGDVSYKWIVGNQTLTGPRQQYIIREQDVETNVTCTVSNHVSEKSAFQTVKCSKDHSHRKETENPESHQREKGQKNHV